MYKVVKDVIAKKRKLIMWYDEDEFNQTVGHTKNHGILKNKPEGKKGFGSKGSGSLNEKERSIKDELIFINLVHPLGPTKNVSVQVPNAPERWEDTHQTATKDAATQVSNAPGWWGEIHHLISKQLKDIHFDKVDELDHDEHGHDEYENVDSYTKLAAAFEEGNEEKQNLLMDRILDVSDLKTEKGVGRKKESKLVWQEERTNTKPKLLKLGDGKGRGQRRLDIGLI